MKHDLRDIKANAIGHWSAIINRVAGIDDDYLHSRHHGPCPKCGGGPSADRWRCFDDFADTGGAICNQCGKFGDGIALTMWSLGIGFPQALDKIAEFLGMQPATKRTTSNSRPAFNHTTNQPTKLATKTKQINHLADLNFDVPTTPASLAWFCKRKRLTTETINDIGGKLARYRNRQLVIAFPVNDGEEIIGWTIYDAYGGTLPKWNPKTKTTEKLKVKTIKK